MALVSTALSAGLLYLSPEPRARRCAPFAEDEWAGIEIAGVRFRTAGACERCIVTTADPPRRRGKSVSH